jgi:hypothetical protein
MNALHQTPLRKVVRLLAPVLLAGALAGTTASAAHAQRAGGPTPSGPGAEVYFIDLKDGATVPAKLKLYFGLRNMGIAPAGSDRENSGHHHLLIDTQLPPLDKPIPNDFNHLHFGAGQTEAEITLKPGEHTLQLLMGDKDHIPHSPPVMSQRIHVRVGGAAEAAGLTAARRNRRQAPRFHFTDPIKEGAVLPPKFTIYLA